MNNKPEIIMADSPKWAVTRNACKLCTPLGACLVFKGVARAVPFLHGSQGCATYIRRYLISHFREPIDIASSNFNEESAVFGGKVNLCKGLTNVISQYQPELIGIMTTCLSETIGDNIPLIIKEYQKNPPFEKLPALVHVSTPSYSGTHIDGFHQAVLALVASLAKSGPTRDLINIFPGLVSPADLNYLKEVLDDYQTDYILLPDYAETLEGSLWNEYKRIPPGGISLNKIAEAGSAKASLEFGYTLKKQKSAAKYLQESCGVEIVPLGLPLGLEASDRFFHSLGSLSDKPLPEKYEKERGKLLDAYVDGHKYLFEKKAAIFGEADLVIALARFLKELGMIPAICAAGEKNNYFKEELKTILGEEFSQKIIIKDGVDFVTLEEDMLKIQPALALGNSKGFSVTRRLNIPLIRLGFPIHDRFGAQRILHIGYRGTLQLYDRIVNSLLERNQQENEWGYTYV